MNWIEIKKQPMPVQGRFLIAAEYGGHRVVTFAEIVEDHNGDLVYETAEGDWIDYDSVTHWAPIPTHPLEDK